MLTLQLTIGDSSGMFSTIFGHQNMYFWMVGTDTCAPNHSKSTQQSTQQ